MKPNRRLGLLILYPIFWLLDVGLVVFGVATWKQNRQESKDVFRRIWNEEP